MQVVIPAHVLEQQVARPRAGGTFYLLCVILVKPTSVTSVSELGGGFESRFRVLRRFLKFDAVTANTTTSNTVTIYSLRVLSSLRRS